MINVTDSAGTQTTLSKALTFTLRRRAARKPA